MKGNRLLCPEWKILGYSFNVLNGKCFLVVNSKAKAKIKSKLRELINRSNGWGYEKQKQKLKEYMRGWVGYFHFAESVCVCGKLGRNLRPRLRTLLDVVYPNGKLANGGVLVKVIGESLILRFLNVQSLTYHLRRLVIHT